MNIFTTFLLSGGNSETERRLSLTNFHHRGAETEEEEEEEEDEDEEEGLINSPEPPEPLEPEEMVQTEESSQAGQLHHEQNLSHIFKVGVSHPQDPDQSDL